MKRVLPAIIGQLGVVTFTNLVTSVSPLFWVLQGVLLGGLLIIGSYIDRQRPE